MAKGHRRPPCRGRAEISAREKIESRRGGEGPCRVRGGWPGTREPARERGLKHATAQSEPDPLPRLLFQRQPAERGDLLHRLERRYTTQHTQLSFLFCSNRNRLQSQG